MYVLLEKFKATVKSVKFRSGSGGKAPETPDHSGARTGRVPRVRTYVDAFPPVQKPQKKATYIANWFYINLEKENRFF